MFVGRKKELESINSFLNSNGALLVYGLRRIGKTTLIKKALNDSGKNYVYFECQKTSEENNVKMFVETLVEQLDFIDAKFDTFLSVFKVLDKNYHDYVFVIDEYSYIKQYYLESKAIINKENSERIDSEFQLIVDNYLNNIELIISGSTIHIMKSLLEHTNPLYGRFNDIIVLNEFNYLEAKEMLSDIPEKDFIGFYSVFGGSPFVLDKIDVKKKLDANIINLIINEAGKIRVHLNNNVINELGMDPDLQDILQVICNGSKKYSEIESFCNITTSGLLDKRLKKLLNLGIIMEKYPIGKENDKRKKYYQIKNNLLKFYYAYVFRKENLINLLGEERFYDVYVASSLNTFISLRFENLVRDYFSIAIRKGMYQDIIEIGSYFTGNSEFDCVLKTNNKEYIIYEVKNYSKPIDDSIIKKEIMQVKNIVGLNVTKMGIVSSSGFKNKDLDVDYLELDDLFFKKKLD